MPEADRATVRVVTDNYHFALSPGGKIGDVEVGRIVFPVSDQSPGKVLLSEFGLSMHFETHRANETRNVLIDFGYSSPTLHNNLDILGIDPAKLDAMVLSHGHYDHFGGMVGFLRETQGKRKPKLPGGEECFCSRQFTAGPTPLSFGALDRKAIVEADLVVWRCRARKRSTRVSRQAEILLPIGYQGAHEEPLCKRFTPTTLPRIAI